MFFKQKTAYEMRISDWSSDVCSSDLAADREHPQNGGDRRDDFQQIHIIHDDSSQRRRSIWSASCAAFPPSSVAMRSSTEIRSSSRLTCPASLALSSVRDRQSTSLNSSH